MSSPSLVLLNELHRHKSITITDEKECLRYDDYSPEEVEELEKRVVRFLKGEDADFEVESIQQVTEAFKIVRRL